MERHGIGRKNENGENLLDICQRNNVVLTDTILSHRDERKVTWISPKKKTENQNDHILVTRQYRTPILQYSKKHKKLTYTSRKIFNTTKPHRPEVGKSISIELKNKLQFLYDQGRTFRPPWRGYIKVRLVG